MAKICVNVCGHCGRKFPTVYQAQKYCTKKCRIEARKLKAESKEQLCCKCQNACGGCSWSRNFTPVKGWEAKPYIIKDSEGNIDSFDIKSCPEFIHD